MGKRHQLNQLNDEKEVMTYTYVDNVGVIGENKTAVDDAMAGIEEKLQAVGLATHETTKGELHVQTLGIMINGDEKIVRVSDKRRQKVSGAIHHSSLTGGHCCRFAGAITVEQGKVRTISPHSGHYVPTQSEYDALIDSWRGAGLDLSEAELRGLVKQPR